MKLLKYHKREVGLIEQTIAVSSARAKCACTYLVKHMMKRFTVIMRDIHYVSM